jgi:Fe2+ transport system protein FeoA
MKLSEAPEGAVLKIVVCTDRRLRDMGFVEGKSVEVLATSPFRCRVCGTCYGLSKESARLVDVDD